MTAETKRKTRKRILDAARASFRSKGFDKTTTRIIANEAGIATGTMFNYFASKESVVVELATLAFDKAQTDFAKHGRKSAGIEEELFALVAAQLRYLRPMRKYVRPLLDSALSPATNSNSDPNAAALRANLTEQFVDILTGRRIDEPSSVTLNIFWALYVGVLTFWGSDKSPKQEDTLAMLDQSIRMFVDWLSH